jgi:hypothetical protein
VICDVAKYQGVINWDALAPQLDFVVIKASGKYENQGDPTYARNVEGAVSHGVPFHVFHFLYCLTEAEAKRDAESGIRDARIIIDTHERGTRRRGELVDALLDVAANPDAVLRLPTRPLRDALRAVFGPLRVTAGKTVEPDNASVYAALCGTEAGESDLVRLFAGVLNPDGLVAAARLLRA